MLQHYREAVWFSMLLNVSCKGDFELLTSRTRPHGRLIAKQPLKQNDSPLETVILDLVGTWIDFAKPSRTLF